MSRHIKVMFQKNDLSRFVSLLKKFNKLEKFSMFHADFIQLEVILDLYLKGDLKVE